MDFGIRVGAVLRRGDSILLVRHEKPGAAPYHVLPGGRLEPGETIPECAERELLEEANLTAEFSEILHVSEFMAEGRHTVDITVAMDISDGEEASLGHDPEVPEGEAPTLADVEWVAVEDVESMDFRPSWIGEAISSEPSGGVYLGGGRH
ncbi:MAG: NUDIX domain-containing protein [Rubrobacter sp.]|nr:NUDIX domain-containing protein [Rubrobacter sp.]